MRSGIFIGKRMGKRLENGVVWEQSKKGDRTMLPAEQNELITRVGPGTPMGETLRRYWMPAAFSREVAEPDCPPVRVKLLGENLVAFRDTNGRVGLVDELCPHRAVSLW